MFCKSCNCNSSIATRIGFAVRAADIPKVALPKLTMRCWVYTDDISAQLDARVAREDSYGY